MAFIFCTIYKIIHSKSEIKNIVLFSRIIEKPNIWKWIMHNQRGKKQTIMKSEQKAKQNGSTRLRKKKNVVHNHRLAEVKDS